MIELSIQKILNFSNGVMPLDIQLNIQKGEFIGFYGSSGAGKTSLLRILAGLLTPDSGKIIIDNKNMNILLGDVEPPSQYYKDLDLYYLVFNLFDYQNVEEIIKEINQEIYGENLVTIPDPNKSYIIKIVSDFSI